MKNLINKITSFGLLLTVVCFTSLSAVSAAEQTGSLEVTVCTEANGIQTTIYDIADYVNGEYEFNVDFKESNVNLENLSDSKSAKSAAVDLQEYAVEKSIKGTSALIDSDGLVSFSNLASEKLYLVIQSSESESIEMQPLLVAVPYYTTDGNVIYDVAVNAKYVEYPPESSVPSEPTSEPTSEPDSEPSTPSEISTPESSDPSTTLTGDDIGKYVIIGAAVLVSLAVIIVLFVTRKKKK